MQNYDFILVLFSHEHTGPLYLHSLSDANIALHGWTAIKASTDIFLFLCFSIVLLSVELVELAVTFQK